MQLRTHLCKLFVNSPGISQLLTSVNAIRHRLQASPNPPAGSHLDSSGASPSLSESSAGGHRGIRCGRAHLMLNHWAQKSTEVIAKMGKYYCASWVSRVTADVQVEVIDVSNYQVHAATTKQWQYPCQGLWFGPINSLVLLEPYNEEGNVHNCLLSYCFRYVS